VQATSGIRADDFGNRQQAQRNLVHRVTAVLPTRRREFSRTEGFRGELTAFSAVESQNLRELAWATCDPTTKKQISVMLCGDSAPGCGALDVAAHKRRSAIPMHPSVTAPAMLMPVPDRDAERLRQMRHEPEPGGVVLRGHPAPAGPAWRSRRGPRRRTSGSRSPRRAGSRRHSPADRFMGVSFARSCATTRETPSALFGIWREACFTGPRL
jgi:hypothetical protein